MLRWLLIFIVIAAVAWWWTSPSSPVAPTTSGAIASSSKPTVIGCAPPAQLAGDDGTVQSDAPGDMLPFQLPNAIAKPLAGFSVAARVLSREDYDHGRESDFSPVDLALGWGRMRDDAVLSQLDISQSGRFYRYRWSGQPPIPPDDIVRSSANMHMVPSNSAIATALDAMDSGDRVRIDGWLVQIDTADGWHWRSSLTRDDSGAGACEVIYVCGVTVR
jgi:hypothetical protein